MATTQTQNTYDDTLIAPECCNQRCCMCPNINSEKRTCPGIPGTPHSDPSPCCFVKAYIDQRGWKYMVKAGIGSSYKARYQKPDQSGATGWKGLAAVPWRESFDDAQTDLNALATAKGWSVWEPD